MRLDQFSNPVFNEQDLFDALYKGQPLSPALIVEPSTDLDHVREVLGLSFTEPYPEDLEITKAEFDAICQNQWFMPTEYYEWSPEVHCMDQCTTEEQRQRVRDELAAFEGRGMVTLLQWLKYFVDTCEKENIVWGIGRGSSVASYVLYLIGVHSVDSIKYNLDWREFLR